MRKQLLAAVLGFGIFAGGAMAADGEAIFKSKGCSACHKPASKSMGPSLKEIAQAYKGKEGDLVKFLKGEAKPIVDPAKFSMMKPQLSKTKALSDDELKALADFILKH
ncbi:cytochrome c [Persephonella hydrogeniphila]|uniref:Cytochrome c n=1 Tax=Persephonella hydrogeniphila TaxID=198703 RepID=A0A285MZ36_9AQUI|nr:c-type cytochrome [Persephonella hydrogeniphila]SNZ02452.1 cytochrome c [Persephonella hydrogeniphila]